MALFDIITDNILNVQRDLKKIVDTIAVQRSLSEEEFVKICSIVRDLKFFVDEIEYNARIKPLDDDLKSLLRSLISINGLHAEPLCSINMEKRARKQKNIK